MLFYVTIIIILCTNVCMYVFILTLQYYYKTIDTNTNEHILQGWKTLNLPSSATIFLDIFKDYVLTPGGALPSYDGRARVYT